MTKIYKNIEYIISINPRLGNYCGYVKLPNGHPFIKLLNKKKWLKLGKKRYVYYDYDAVPIECHGGLTFGDKILAKNKSLQGFTPGWWVGWDYSHIGDYIHFFPKSRGKKWTEKEIEAECKKVINQLIKLI